jgi:hypothetical protein
MFESENRSDSSSKISIGRISYCAVAALPVVLLVRLWVDPGEALGDFLQSIVMILMSLLLTGIGAVILIRSMVKRLPILFWSIALFFAALPLLVAIIGMVVTRH